MTVEKFLGILKLLRDTDSSTDAQASIEAVASALSNLSNSPADVNYQAALATALSNLDNAASGIASNLSALDSSYIAVLGGAEYFDPAIAANVRAAISSNPMTPAVARDFVKNLSSGRASFMKTIKDVITNLTSLGVTAYELKDGNADVSFVIPRELFDNEIGSFATELRFIDRLLRHLTEAISGKVEPPTLEALSTTQPIVALFSDPHVLSILARGIQSFLDAWEKIERIRKLRKEIAELNIADEALEKFDEKIEQTVDEVIEETVKFSMKGSVADPGRTHELTGFLNQDFRRLFGQIERGLVVEFRARPDGGPDEHNEKALEQIRDIGQKLKYPEPDPQPLLLSAGEILEGEIVRTKRTSTTTKTERKRSGST